MSQANTNFEAKARHSVAVDFARRQVRPGGRLVWLVSYPRSGSTLLRAYCAILQGRPQYSVYPGDVEGVAGVALASHFDTVHVVKTHQMPDGTDPIIYLVRDGRNATLSFLYLAFLSGGHHFSRLDDVHDAIAHLDRTEGRWTSHVTEALRQSERRPLLILRYEDLIQQPEAVLGRLADFLGVTLPAAVIASCVERQRREGTYTSRPNSGYLFVPESGTIYDVLQQHRTADYWRYILDRRSKAYLHEQGATALLQRFGYEQAADWWAEDRIIAATLAPR